MKRIIFGILITVIGFVFAAFCFIHAALNPWTYNGISGLLGSFLGTDMLMPFIISLIVLLIGLGIVYFEAYRRK